MPAWLSLLVMAVKVLTWFYGHEAVVKEAIKYTPLPKDPDPPLRQSNNPNQTNHFGGL